MLRFVQMTRFMGAATGVICRLQLRFLSKLISVKGVSLDNYSHLIQTIQQQLNTFIMEPYKTEEYRGYQIQIVYDDDCVDNPREWSDVCTMNCYHRHYCLGDNQCKGNPWDDLRSIILEHIPTKEIIKLIQEHAENVKITHNNKKWRLCQYDGHTQQFELYDEFDLSYISPLCDSALEAVADKYLFSIIENSSTVAISNIYMYDHSGITISLGRFSCPWDSGCVGFIYVTKERILKEVGGANEKNWRQKANERFASEANVYDSYLRGEVFCWSIHERINADAEDEEPEYDKWSLDSCCGYIGSDEVDYMISEAKSAIDRVIERKEAELVRKRSVVTAELSSIPVGTTFVIENEMYRINDHNLFNEVQISVAAIVKHQVCHVWNPVTIGSLKESVLDVLCKAIEQLKAA